MEDRERQDGEKDRLGHSGNGVDCGVVREGSDPDRSLGRGGRVTEASADRFAETFGIAKAHGNYEAWVADPEVDIIYIATPHPQHVSAAKLALNAGKHILVKKPLTLNAKEAAEIVDLARAKNLVALEAMWTRFLPHMRRIREIVTAGTIGEVRSITADHRQKLPDDPKHRLNALELGGGALPDLGIYPISFAWDILGRPASINATATFRDTGVDAQVATLFHYASGAIVTTISSSDSAGSNRASVVGTRGRIEIDRVWYPIPSAVRCLRRTPSGPKSGPRP